MPDLTRQSRKHIVFRTIAVFLASYLFFLLLWIQVKDGYGYIMTVAASKIVAGLKDARVAEITRDKEFIQATFAPARDYRVLVDIPVKTSSYTFNSPLTFAIIVTLSSFLSRRKRAWAEAAVALGIIHFLYVFSLEAKELTDVFIERQIESPGTIKLAGYQFLWSFTENMVIRFEPFLIGFYLFMKFRKKPVNQPKKKPR